MLRLQCCLTFLVIVIVTSSVPAQESITAASAKEFTRQELRQRIRDAAYEAVKENLVPRQLFDAGYNRIEEDFLIKVRPTLLKKFKWVESTGSRNNHEL